MGSLLPEETLPPGVHLAVVGWDDNRLARMRADQQAELAALYDGQGDMELDLPPEEMLATVALNVDGEVVACGSLRDAHRYGDGYGELKRMYVRPEHRGRGYSRFVLRRLEGIAAAKGLRRLILETGLRQVEAVGLYRSEGYRRIPCYGPYDEETLSVCYAKWLTPDQTRLLVVNGTVGAGKTTVAEVVADLLREWHVPYAWIDVDTLRHAYPTAADDPFGQAVALDHLQAMAGVLRRRGYRHVVLAEVIENRDDRELYERAFDGAELTVVRLDASQATRVARLDARERDPWRDWHLTRTVQLAGILETASVDDAVVDNDGARPLREVAAEVLMVAGWA